MHYASISYYRLWDSMILYILPWLCLHRTCDGGRHITLLQRIARPTWSVSTCCCVINISGDQVGGVRPNSTSFYHRIAINSVWNLVHSDVNLQITAFGSKLLKHAMQHCSFSSLKLSLSKWNIWSAQIYQVVSRKTWTRRTEQHVGCIRGRWWCLCMLVRTTLRITLFAFPIVGCWS